MKTRLIQITGDEEGAIKDAAAILRAGGLVAFPTETVYGLGALGLDRSALRKVFWAKNRPHEDPLILHVSCPEWIDDLANELTNTARVLVEAFWPGPLTVIVSKSTKVPDLVSAGLPSVALRMPAHPVALALIREVNAPLAAPSANRFGRTSPTTDAHVLSDLEGRIDAVLSAGRTRVGVESTVVDTRNPEEPIILRPGGVSREAIEAALGITLTKNLRLTPQDNQPAISPGLLTRHYSPLAAMRLFLSDGGPMPTRMVDAIECATRQGGNNVGVLAYSEDLPRLEGLPVTVEVLGGIEDHDLVAKNLFSSLRKLDNLGARVIFARTINSSGIGETINDRLVRAAAGRTE